MIPPSTKYWLLLVLFWGGGYLSAPLRGCLQAAPVTSKNPSVAVVSNPNAISQSKVPTEPKDSLSTAQRLENIGLVDVSTLDEALIVYLPYATTRNFTGEILYTDLDRAFLQPEVAQKLLQALHILRRSHPDLTLIIYDAARPISIQRRMWEVVKGTPNYLYVSNPNSGGGLHNYGAAVDVTLADSNGNPLPMGTPFDHFGPEAHIDHEAELVAQGKITLQEAKNRKLLREVMTQAGFIPLKSEWWHFNAMRLTEAKNRYPRIE